MMRIITVRPEVERPRAVEEELRQMGLDDERRTDSAHDDDERRQLTTTVLSIARRRSRAPIRRRASQENGAEAPIDAASVGLKTPA
jgi:hypothetical protein